MPIVRRSAEVQHEQAIGERPVGEHAARRAMPTSGRQAFGMVDLGEGRVHRQCWIGAGKREARHLADGAAPAVATHEIGAADPASARRGHPLHIDTVRVLDELRDVARAAQLDPEGARTIEQHVFDGLLIHQARMPFRLCLRVLAEQGQAGEMTAELFRASFRSGSLRELLHHRKAARFRSGDGLGHSAALQGFASERSDPQGFACRVQGG